jgi:D-tyrosyl-tRNA(Tyr) deacylase
VGEAVVGEIGPGLFVLLGVAREDGADAATRLAEKVARLRIFENDEGRFERSLLDTGEEALVVSQFTLIADTGKGNRPSFTDAATPEDAEPLYEAFCAELQTLGLTVATGSFGARMTVEIVNDGPVTIVLDA